MSVLFLISYISWTDYVDVHLFAATQVVNLLPVSEKTVVQLL